MWQLIDLKLELIHDHLEELVDDVSESWLDQQLPRIVHPFLVLNRGDNLESVSRWVRSVRDKRQD